MAPKRILEDPPAASSMEEEEDSDPTDGEEEEENDVVGPEHDDEDGEEEEEDDEEEEEEENVNEKKGNPKPVAPVPIAKPESSSDGEDDDGSETESDDDSGIGDFTVKPIVSKPNNTTTDSAKPSAKKPAVATPTKAPKRAAETDLASKGSKKKKGSGSGGGGDDEDTRKGRLWSEEDEIAILKGMIDYKAKKGLDPSANLGPFHEFLKKTLKVDVSKNQLADKMRRLKKKYLTNADKSENGEDPVFSKAHETKSFDLSKKIWGVEVNGADDSAKNSKKKKPRKTANVNANAKGNNSATVLALPVSDASEKKVEVEKKVELNVANGGGVKVVKAELEDFSVKYPHLSGSLKGGLSGGVDSFIFQNLPALGSSKVKDLDAKWKKLQLLELDLAVGKLDLMHEQSKLVMDAVKSWKD